MTVHPSPHRTSATASTRHLRRPQRLQRPSRRHAWPLRLIAATSLCLATTAATAQSAPSGTVLYGIVDQSLTFTNNRDGQRLVRSGTGTFSGSRWGLKINESLGNGLQAIGVMEAGFDSNTGRSGQGGAQFGRQAYVGLAHQPFGTVTFGRQYDAFVDLVSPVTAGGSWASGVNGRLYGNDNAGLLYRLNNTVKYASPSKWGAKAVATYSFSNAAAMRENRAFSIGANYVSGPFTVAGAFVQLDNPNGANGNGAAVDRGSFAGSKQQTWGGGLTYQLGQASLGANYSHVRVTDPTAFPGGAPMPAVAAAQLRMDNFELHAKYQMSVALTTGLVYIHTRGRALNAAGKLARPHWHQFGGVADYFLSKRTDVYLAAAYQRAGGGQAGDAAFDRAILLSGGGLSSGNSQWTAHVGLRHRF